MIINPATDQGSESMSYIIQLDDAYKVGAPLVGGKAANLSQLWDLGLDIPPGFCITTRAYRDFLLRTGLDQAQSEKWRNLDRDAQIEALSAHIRSVIMTSPLPDELEIEIRDAYRGLIPSIDAAEHRVAVRSSARMEDSAKASFAGLFETSLNIADLDGLFQAVLKCWASFWSSQALDYRKRRGFDALADDIAVIVQRMVPAQKAGVIFTANPVTNDRGEVYIEASWGLGDALVSGNVTPGSYVLDKEKLALKTKVCRDASILNDEQLRWLGEIGRRIENFYRCPQDIEWAFHQNKFFILQSRPITTLQPLTSSESPGQSKQRIDGWTDAVLNERFPFPLKPLASSILREWGLEHSLRFALRSLGFKIGAEKEFVRIIDGRPFINQRVLSDLFRDLPVNPFSGPSPRRRSQVNLKPKTVFRLIGLLCQFIYVSHEAPKSWRRVLPKFLSEIEKLKRKDFASLSTPELLDQLMAIERLTRYIFKGQILRIILAEALYHGLEEMLGVFLGKEAKKLARILVTGLADNKTIETNHRIQELTARINRTAGLRRALLDGDPDSFLLTASQFEEGREFLREFNQFLDEYGHRSPSYDLSLPAWGERPQLVLSLITTEITTPPPNTPSPEKIHSTTHKPNKAPEALSLIKQHLQRNRKLTPLAPLKYWTLQQVLQLTSRNISLREDCQFHITKLWPITRRLLSQIGKRLSDRGVLETDDDVYFLQLEEVKQLLSGAHKGNLCTIVANRKAEYSEFLRKPQISSRQFKDSTGRLKGIGASAGVVSGIARIILSSSDFHKLRSGEIIVAHTTNPAWTPLFAHASALVTDVGGVLSHGAIVAREYGIVAVMGVGKGTTVIQDGQQITVDGNEGLVYLEATEPAKMEIVGAPSPQKQTGFTPQPKAADALNQK
jgi:pyruvate,water dikinase